MGLSTAIIATGLSYQVALAKSLAYCDPNIEGFWRNLSCQNEWNERIAIKTSHLNHLIAEYNDLELENATLKKRVNASEKMVDDLEQELAPLRERLEALNNTRYTQQNAERYIQQIIEELELISAGLSLMAIAESGCETVAYVKYRSKAKAQGVAVDETIRFFTGQIKSKAFSEGVIYVAPKVIKHTIKKLLGFSGMIMTLIDGFKAVVNVTKAYTTDRQYYEYQRRCN